MVMPEYREMRVQTDDVSNLQPLWALLAEEEFHNDDIQGYAMRERRRALEILLAQDRRMEEEERRARQERRWQEQAALRYSRERLNMTEHRSLQHHDASERRRQISLAETLRRRRPAQEEEERVDIEMERHAPTEYYPSRPPTPQRSRSPRGSASSSMQ